MKVIQQESYTYKDPITEFLECLYVNFDFDGAQQKLRECETVSALVKLFKKVRVCECFVKQYYNQLDKTFPPEGRAQSIKGNKDFKKTMIL